jgi:hypothetical protein
VRGDQRHGAFGDRRNSAEQLAVEQPLLGPLASLRLELGARTTRKVDRLSCVRFGSARHSEPCRLIGQTVTITTTDKMITMIELLTGEVLAEYQLVAPGETSIVDDHYGGLRPDRPRRAPRARTQTEEEFLGLGEVAEPFLVGRPPRPGCPSLPMLTPVEIWSAVRPCPGSH